MPNPLWLRGLFCKGLFGVTLLSMTILSVGCPDGAGSGNNSGELLVLSASNLSAVLPDIASDFTSDTGIEVEFSFGSSGQLSQQIIQGGRADVFISADRRFVDEVADEGLAYDDTRQVFAVVQMVMWWADDLGVADPTGIADLQDEGFKRIALANTNHAPSGIAAKSALQKTGIWDAIEGRLVFGESAAQTIQFARSGNTEVAIVPKSLAVQEAAGDYIPISADLYDPLEQEAVVLNDSMRPNEAAEFVEYLTSSTAAELFAASGFEVLDEVSSD